MGWVHYGSGRKLAPGTCSFDVWPDLAEFSVEERYPSPFVFFDGMQADLFSSAHPKTVGGTPDVRTPHIDRIFKEGMAFANFRANSCVCSPTRAALLSGCYPDRVGVPGVIREEQRDNSWGYFLPGITTLPQTLRSAGSHSALVGKWHLGVASPNTPNERAFNFVPRVSRGHDGRLLDASSQRPEFHEAQSGGDHACRPCHGLGSPRTRKVQRVVEGTASANSEL